MSSSGACRRGFSLLELMFATAIGSVILILAATLLGISSDGYQRVVGSVASEREARAIIAQLASDLGAATFHESQVIEKSTQPWPTDRIGFLSLQPAAAQTEAGRIGDLCAVNYYIDDFPIGGRTVRCLMRGFRESHATFKAVKIDLLTPLFEKMPNFDEPIAFGVVSFEARPRSRDAAGQWVDWLQNDLIGPEAIDIRLVIARRELAGKLKSAADWQGGGMAGELLGTASEAHRSKHLEVYATSLRFGNHESR